MGAYICCALTVVFATLFVVFRIKKHLLLQLLFKALAGVGFVFTSVFATFHNGLNPLYSSLLLCGAVMGLVGDIFLMLKAFNKDYYKLFVLIGMGLFAIGHFFYFGALLFSSKLTVYPFIIAFAFAVFSFFALGIKKFEKVGKIKPFCSIYFFVLSATLFQAIFAYCYNSTTQLLLFLIGACFFFVSDFLLAFIYFGGATKRRFTIINLTTYYIAQLTIALSILFII